MTYLIYNKLTGDPYTLLTTNSDELARINCPSDQYDCKEIPTGTFANRYNVSEKKLEFVPPVVYEPTTEELFVSAKQRKAYELSLFGNIFTSPTSSYTTTTLTTNIMVNARTSDMNTAKELRDMMVEQSLSEVTFRCFDNSFVQITLEDLGKLISELRLYSLSLYQKKWALEEAINKATTKEELDLIQW